MALIQKRDCYDIIKKISVCNDIATAMCYPEGKEDNKFELTVSVSREHIICHSCKIEGPYLRFAKKLLLEAARSNPVPEEDFNIWY